MFRGGNLESIRGEEMDSYCVEWNNMDTIVGNVARNCSFLFFFYYWREISVLNLIESFSILGTDQSLCIIFIYLTRRFQGFIK